MSHPASISITDSISSLPQPKTRGPVPDFVIILVHAILSATGMPVPASIRVDSFDHWGKIKIENLVVGMAAEVKRRPTRSAKSPDEFRTSLTSRIQEARGDAVVQAAAVFLAHDGTDRIVLLAWSGEWYSWMLAVREDFAVTAMPRREIASEDKDESSGVHKETEEVPEEAQAVPGEAEQTPEAGSELRSEVEASVPQPTASGQAVQDMDPASCAGTGARKQPPRISKAAVATVEGFYADRDPLAGLSSNKIPYNPKPKPKPEAEKSDEELKDKDVENTEPHPRRKPTKATFKRYTPADLVGVMETQQILTPEECNDPDLSRNDWSDPIPFGTLESKQNWFLIHQFLAAENTRLNEPHNLGMNYEGDEENSGQNEDERSNEERNNYEDNNGD